MKIRTWAALALGMAMLSAPAMAAELPQDQFITKDALMELCRETNGGDGLLATGTESDVKLRIQFGARPEAVEYLDVNGTKKTASGPVSWLLAGEEDDALVLYGEEPVIGARAFETDSNEKTFEESFGDYEGSAPGMVAANHWGASDLRAALEGFRENGFAGGEKELMLPSVVHTPDTKNGANYTTQDYLYAPVGDYSDDKHINVGADNGLRIDMEHWVSRSWLRSPHESTNNYVLCTQPGYYVVIQPVDAQNCADATVMKLDAGSLLFASAAGTAGGLKEIPANAPMRLRIEAHESLGDAKVSPDGTALAARGEGVRLMIQGANADGSGWATSRALDGHTLRLAAGDVKPGLTSLEDCRVWLEKDEPDSGTLTFAQMAEVGDIGSKGGEAPDGAGREPENGAQSMPETGDGSSLMAWGALMALACAGLAAGRRARRRE